MIDVCVCVGSSCHMKGSYLVIEALKRLISLNNAEEKIVLKASFCSGNCTNGVCMEICGEKITNVTPQKIESIFNEKILPLINK
ncbi:MAG: NADH:ubiquinone oxidoreductase 24 kD subunit [Oscillospiraceae bacterium]|nr:NADH:ubiquinone oxidoreductase 24 kD subunit [Oscillospiraceae bacterium]